MRMYTMRVGDTITIEGGDPLNDDALAWSKHADLFRVIQSVFGYVYTLENKTGSDGVAKFILTRGEDTEPDTGTSVYKPKYGHMHQYEEELQMKAKLYRNESISEEEYEKAFDAMADQYVETVTVENVYNRLVLFNNKTHHGVKTFGTKPRLTLNFFGIDFSGKRPPLVRTR